MNSIRKGPTDSEPLCDLQPLAFVSTDIDRRVTMRQLEQKLNMLKSKVDDHESHLTLVKELNISVAHELKEIL